MPYLNLDLDYFEHRKTKRLVGRLGKGSEVLPVKLWVYVGKYHAENGRLSGYSEAEIGSIVGWWRDPSELVQAMLDVGFLGRDDQGFYVHEWTAHEGHLEAFKVRSKKANDARWEAARRAKMVVSSMDATSIPQASHKDSPLPTKPTQPTKDPPSPKGVKVDIPDSLRTKAFEESWGRWQQHRSEIRHPLKPTMAKSQLAKLEKMGVANAVQSIEESISNGWQGLFEPKVKAPRAQLSPEQRDAQDRQVRERQLTSQREREIAAADAARRVEAVKALPPEERERLRQQCIEVADGLVRGKLERDDPLAGRMLTVLIYARMQTEKAGAA